MDSDYEALLTSLGFPAKNNPSPTTTVQETAASQSTAPSTPVAIGEDQFNQVFNQLFDTATASVASQTLVGDGSEPALPPVAITISSDSSLPTIFGGRITTTAASDLSTIEPFDREGRTQSPAPVTNAHDPLSTHLTEIHNSITTNMATEPIANLEGPLGSIQASQAWIEPAQVQQPLVDQVRPMDGVVQDRRAAAPRSYVSAPSQLQMVPATTQAVQEGSDIHRPIPPPQLPPRPLVDSAALLLHAQERESLANEATRRDLSNLRRYRARWAALLAAAQQATLSADQLADWADVILLARRLFHRHETMFSREGLKSLLDWNPFHWDRFQPQQATIASSQAGPSNPSVGFEVSNPRKRRGSSLPTSNKARRLSSHISSLARGFKALEEGL